MKRLSGFLVLALAGTLWAEEFNKDTYPPRTLAQAAAKDPCRASFEVKDKPFSTEVVYQGAFHDTPARRFELVGRWARKLGDPAAGPRYKKEVSFAEGKKVHWIPVPEGLVPILESDLQPGDRAIAYLVFAGCVDNAPVFTLDEFEALDSSVDEDEDVIVYNYRDRRGA